MRCACDLEDIFRSFFFSPHHCIRRARSLPTAHDTDEYPSHTSNVHGDNVEKYILISQTLMANFETEGQRVGSR